MSAVRTIADGPDGLVTMEFPLPAEPPRWPSGPDAERELAAALRKVIGLAFVWADGWGPANDRDDADAVAHWTVEALAALQEKRDPGE